MPVVTPTKPTAEAADQSALDSYLKSRAQVTATDLKAPFRNTDLFELPTFEGEWIEVQLPKGKSTRRLKNIEDANPGLKYFWIDEKTSKIHPRFRHGFYLVQKGNSGAVNIPDKHFGAAGVITRGEHYLWFCTIEHWAQMRKVEDETLFGQLGSYHEEDAAKTGWAKGGNEVMGFANQTELKHGLVDDDDES
jgi:hypothetical protein